MTTHCMLAVDRLIGDPDPLRQWSDDHAETLVFDCHRVDELGAVGIARIMQVASRARQCGRRLVVIGCLPLVERALRAVGMQRLADFRRPRGRPASVRRAAAG